MVIHENIYVLELEYVKFFLKCHKTLNNKDSVKEENLKAEIFLLLDESLCLATSFLVFAGIFM